MKPNVTISRQKARLYNIGILYIWENIYFIQTFNLQIVLFVHFFNFVMYFFVYYKKSQAGSKMQLTARKQRRP